MGLRLRRRPRRPPADHAGSADTVVRPGAVRALAAALPLCALEWLPASHTGLIAVQRPAVYARIATAAAATAAAATAAADAGGHAAGAAAQ